MAQADNLPPGDLGVLLLHLCGDAVSGLANNLEQAREPQLQQVVSVQVISRPSTD